MAALPVLGALLLSVAGQQTVAAPCPHQPMPPAESALPARPYETAIVYEAVPSFSRHAWVVRLSRRISAGPALIEIARVRRQRDCNRYDIEAQWQGSMPAEEFVQMGRRLAPHALAGRASTTDDPFGEPGEVALDGTEVSLTLRNHRWRVTRDLVEGGRDGGPVSAIFRAIMARIVPADRDTASDR